MSKRQTSGFTLIELMVTIAIMAIALAIALPSFQGSLRSNRVSTTTNELLASLSLARTEAIKSTMGGGVCSSANGTTCGGTWNDGWVVWTDTNRNGVFNAGTDTVVRYSQAKSQLVLTGSANAADVTFDGRGRRLAAADQTIEVIPVGAETPARCLSVTVTGQVRTEQEACT